MPMKIVVIGNGMVGHRLLEQMCAKSASQHDITVLCEVRAQPTIACI